MALTAELQWVLTDRLGVSRETLAEFCRRWQVAELALFGSVLREDFSDRSDVDVLVTFAPGERWTLLDWVHLQDDLAALVGREVDLVEKKQLNNPYRRAKILRTHQVVSVE